MSGQALTLDSKLQTTDWAIQAATKHQVTPPFLCGMETGTTSALNAPAFQAA